VALLCLIDETTVVVGHGLAHDHAALKLAHRKCLDTSLLFSSDRGPSFKPSLCYLAREHLGRVIQGSASGHCSAEVCLTPF
jgi:RNA exonuclease 1